MKKKNYYLCQIRLDRTVKSKLFNFWEETSKWQENLLRLVYASNEKEAEKAIINEFNKCLSKSADRSLKSVVIIKELIGN